MTRVAVVGCGLIGRKRLQALPDDAEVVALIDLDLRRAEVLAATLTGTRPSIRVADSIEAGLDGARAEVAIVATVHSARAERSCPMGATTAAVPHAKASTTAPDLAPSHH